MSNKTEHNAPESGTSAKQTTPKTKQPANESELAGTNGTKAEILSFDQPLYAVDICHDLVFVGGGGGRGNTGIPNSLLLLNLEEENPEQPLLRHIATLDRGEFATMNLAIHPTKHVIACGAENACEIFSFSQTRIVVGCGDSEKERKVFQTDFTEGEDASQDAVIFNKTGDRFFTGGNDGIVRVWAFPSLAKQEELNLELKSVNSLSISPDDALLLAASDRKCVIWDIGSSKVLATLTPPDRFLFRGCVFAPTELRSAEAKRNITPSEKLTSYIIYTAAMQPKRGSLITKWRFDRRTEKCTRITSTKAHAGSHHGAFAISPDGRTVATGTVDGDLTVFRTSDLKIIKRVTQAHDYFVTGLAFSPSGSALVSCSADQTVRVVRVNPNAPPEGMARKRIVLLLAIVVLLVALYWNRIVG